jgi:hypothetical protein
MTALSMARRQELREDYPLWRRQLPVGYCECAGGAKRHPVGCKAGSHQPFTCADVCAPPDGGALATARAGASWRTSARITPNNRNFPAGDLTTGPNLPLDDLTAVMAGIYGSAPGSHGRCCQLVAPRHVSLLIVHTKYTKGRRLDDTA